MLYLGIQWLYSHSKYLTSYLQKKFLMFLLYHFHSLQFLTLFKNEDKNDRQQNIFLPNHHAQAS